MFGSRKNKNIAEAVMADTKRILEVMRSFPPEVRQECAQAVGSEIANAVDEMEDVAARSDEMVEIIQRHATRAKEFRHLTIQRGATDEFDPHWSAAALYESWVFAASGSLNKAKAVEICGKIQEWIDEEFERWKEG